MVKASRLVVNTAIMKIKGRISPWTLAFKKKHGVMVIGHYKLLVLQRMVSCFVLSYS